MELFTAKSYFELIAFGFGTGVYGTLIGAGGVFCVNALVGFTLSPAESGKAHEHLVSGGFY